MNFNVKITLNKQIILRARSKINYKFDACFADICGTMNLLKDRKKVVYHKIIKENLQNLSIKG